MLAIMVSHFELALFAYSLGHKSRLEAGVIELFYTIKVYVQCTVGSGNEFQPAFCNCMHTHLFFCVCLQFGFVFLVCFTGFISIVVPSVARPFYDLKHTLVL